MAGVVGMRALFTLYQSVKLPCGFWLIPPYLTSRLCSTTTKNNETKPPMNLENESLLENLNLMGVDVKMVRQRQPGVLRKVITNEHGLSLFLQRKGADSKVIASIISRYPRAITRSAEHLEQRWELLRNIFQTDSEIVSIMDRSPESFFRSSDNENLEKNITFLTSLRLKTKDLHRMLTKAPRTFANSLGLNKKMVEFLEGICVELGGKDPQAFAKTVISRNVYILISSTKKVKKNVDYLKASLRLSDAELLALLQGSGAEILDLSNEYLKKNFNNLHQKMVSLGCRKTDVKNLILKFPMVLYLGREKLNTKLECLLKGGIKIKQVVEKPKVLDFSTQNIAERLKELQKVGYDFEKNGINIFDSSKKRFVARIKKLTSQSND
ncbi:transcription termination factor 1, mitochondrial [Betta splendens]|uniref:Transcription termination factor 1, mitochondrial n=1 Tax=Betta splendens TaxID=158456 RepID=A0A6P7NTP9_BETSP|nr:transcription termination factor 1, mitochondrial [Betta splendens]XP_029023280.1 transcription termination factor 1, mitochondrial [Betta splendens]XP_029023281.1 transcription termination factor 1, mitochondrial [Betta splendens]XP_029023282.1 transcription termination factor 1, mitochondrial [Betta splendens]XP_029023283.1 transcription termination factor 1, mitochondrial [Betta splendens]XP_029023284.1 transcription termination factor 1, mitochondrial [Betta splendens]